MVSNKSLTPIFPCMGTYKLNRFSKKYDRPNTTGKLHSKVLLLSYGLIALHLHELTFANAMENFLATTRYLKHINNLDNLDFDYGLNTTHFDSFPCQLDSDVIDNETHSNPNNAQTKVNQLLLELDKLDSNWEFLQRLQQIVQTEDLDVIKGVFEDFPTLMKLNNPSSMGVRNILDVAIEHRNFTIVEYLLTTLGKFETDESKKQLFYFTEILQFMEHIHEIPPQNFTKKLQILQLALHRHPGIIKWQFENYPTLLHFTMVRNFTNGKHQLELIQMLIDNNVDVNAEDSRGNTPLHLAILTNPTSPNLIEIIRILIENQANPGAVSTECRCEENDSKCVPNHALTFLHLAAESCDPETFYQIVSHLNETNRTSSFHVLDEQGRSLLYYILKNRKLEDVQMLEKILQLFKSRNVDFNTVDDEGFSVLFYAFNATGNYNNSYTNLLISFGADSNIKNRKTQQTLLHVAVEADDLSAINLFLALGADVNAQDWNGYTPLHQAFQSCTQIDFDFYPGYSYCSDNLYDIVNQLLKHGAKTRLKDKWGNSIEDLVNSKISDEEEKGSLLELIKTKEVNNTFKELNATMTAAHLTSIIEYEDLNIIKVALQVVAKNMDLAELRFEKHKSLLHMAVEFSRYEVVEYLLDSQGFSEKLNETRLTEGLMSVCLDSIDMQYTFVKKALIIELLLKHQPELINSKIGVRENTPLHVVSMLHFRNGLKLQFIQRLVKKNANVNARNKDGNTPLHLLVLFKPLESNFLDIIRLLVNHQADLNAVDKHGRTLLHIAVETVQRRKILPEQFHELVEYLTQINKTELLKMVDTNGANVLHRAILNFEVQNSTLQLLTEGGVDFNAVDYNGYSVSDYAKWGCRSTSFINTLDIKCIQINGCSLRK